MSLQLNYNLEFLLSSCKPALSARGVVHITYSITVVNIHQTYQVTGSDFSPLLLLLRRVWDWEESWCID